MNDHLVQNEMNEKAKAGIKQLTATLNELKNNKLTKDLNFQ